MHLVVQAIAAGVAVLVAAKLVPGVRVKSNSTAITVAIVFAVLNALFGWLVRFAFGLLLLPAAVLTFGLAALFLGMLVNTALVWATDKVVEDFEIRSLRALLGTSALVTFFGWLLPRFL